MQWPADQTIVRVTKNLLRHVVTDEPMEYDNSQVVTCKTFKITLRLISEQVRTVGEKADWGERERKHVGAMDPSDL